ncbi:uncharacterized protein LOC125646673 isoform X4 [Ostrea edulis]|uniref:uncharacterized protein LOC125646673 isoform X4 n=1 Tax=Ostrea edulis TaxID=37623 RepID=UPI0024AFC823|nr:uncharacterized protein LOC125646673 isoform X4 [Ostrea edulis]
MTSSVFLERNLGDLPLFDRSKKGSTSSKKTNGAETNDTFIVRVSARKPMGIPEARAVPHPSVRPTVRRRLNFLDSDDDFQPTPGFDFTDKMAAFRELLKKDSERDAERNKKNFQNRYIGEMERCQKRDQGRGDKQSENGLPRSREARRLLSRLADEKLAGMSYRNYRAQLHLESASDLHSSQERRTEEPRRESKSESRGDNYLDKFLSERTSVRSSSHKREASHQNDADLDKIPQKESQVSQQTNNNKSPLCQKNPLQEPGLLFNDTMGSTSTLSRKTGKGSIQSNVPHYHPSYVSAKEPPSGNVRSLSKQPNSKGLCEGVRTGEVIYTKSRSGKTSQTNARSTPPSTSKEDGGILTLQDLAYSPGKSKSKKRKTKERQKSEEKIRKNIRELKEDLNISDSSKENEKVSSKGRRRTSKEEFERKTGEIPEGTDEPKMTGLVNVEAHNALTARRAVFGPRHPETEGDRKREGSDGVWRPPDGSVSGSVRSIGSQSSTIMAVELLRKMYNVDPRTRQDLVLKAKCFRRWLKNVQSMHSIDERSPYAQSGQESYVGDPPWGLSGLLGSARLTETDSDDNALLSFPHDILQINGQNGMGLVKNTVESNGTNFVRYDTKFGEHRTPDEKITKKVAPITKENLERHTQIVQSNVQPFSSIHMNDGPSAFNIVRPCPVNQKDFPGENGIPTTPWSMVTRGNNTSQAVQRTDKILYPQYTNLKPEVPIQNLSSNATRVASVSACQPVVCSASKCVTDSARIARGLGRATNLVLPSVSDSFTQLLDTANYGVCLQSAELFHQRRVQRDFFFKWKRIAAEHVIIRAADNLHRLHTLKKGMDAFKWAINRSRIMVDIYQNKLKGVLMSATFYKWSDRAVSSRQERMRVTFGKWRHFTEESQKIRCLQDSIDHKLLIQMMNTWREKFQIRVKENSAYNHFRTKILTQMLTAWRIYTLESKEKQRRDEMARNLYSERLQSKMFTCMVILYRKMSAAKLHHRNQSLHMVLQNWKQGALISREEHEMNLVQSQEHWKKNQLQHCFVHWHDLLLTERAILSANHKLTRNAFIIWKTSWEHQVHYREEIDARIRYKILSTSLSCWRENVAVLKKRREAAVVFLQRVLVRHILHGWKNYTQHKKQLRTIQRSLTNRLNVKIQRKVVSLWKQQVEERLNLRRAQTFWSNTCARKSVVQWKKVCHKRALLRLLNNTEPIRQQNLLKRMFQKWWSIKERIESENQEVEQMRGILERSQLERRFSHWKAEMLLRLRIRPLVQRRQTGLLTESFKAWYSLVQQKKECRNNNSLFLKSKLRKCFSIWRHQFLIQAVEKDLKKKVETGFVRRCLSGWREVIRRKKEAQQFHNTQLMKQTFVEWHYKAIKKMKERLATKEEQEYNNFLLKSYFTLWCTNAQQQKRYEQNALDNAEESRKNLRMESSFRFWRHHLRATLVAREHQKMLQRKLMVQIVVEWRDVADHSMKRAVHEFAVRIGLQTPEDYSGETLSTSGDSETSERLQLLTDMILASENTSGIHSPVASSTLGTPMKRLFSPTLSRVSLDLDRSIPEMDYKPSLANTSFIDARFEMEQAVKTERMKTLVTTAVKRIQFWPLSIMFDHWWEYTVHQKELRSLCTQANEIVVRQRLKFTFRVWKTLYQRETQARHFREECLKRRVFEALQENKKIMKHKKKLSALAHGYHSLTVFRKIFPVWFEKAQEMRHTRSVVHIWNSRTEQEQELYPLEDVLRNRLTMKTLRKCFAVWQLKFLQIDKLRKTYYKIIQQRYFEIWREWAQRKAQLRKDSQAFSNHRIQSWAFHSWLLRQQQMVVLEQKIKDTQTQNMKQLIQSWHHWASENKKRRLAHLLVMQTSQRNLVARTFTTWRIQTEKCQQIAIWCQKRQMIRVLREWQEVTVWKKEMKRKALAFQVKSYTKQVIRIFKVWHSQYLERVEQHEEHEAYIRRCVVHYGRHWMRQAQKARGRRLLQVFRNRQVASCFDKWKYMYERNLERENQLNKCLVRRNRRILGTFLDNWKIKLLSNQATRHFNVKLLGTFFSEWHVFASESKQRRVNCAVYQRALEQRTVKSYFKYWNSLTQVQNDIKKHCDLKLQIRVLREWHIYAHRRHQLATLGSLLTKHVQTNTLKRAWYTIKVQADYCQNLNETASKVLMEKNRQCMRQALSIWWERLNRIVAGRCYHHLLARRTVRQWRLFVEKKKEEREIERLKNEAATRHHNKHVCKLAFRALHNEVKVKHQLQRHKLRLQKKYGGIWKHRVDLMYTAKCVEEERLLLQSWNIWRIAFSRHRATDKVTAYNDRQILSQAFLAWKEVCFERIDKVRKSVQFYVPSLEVPTQRPSQLPTPVNRTQGKASRKSTTPF